MGHSTPRSYLLWLLLLRRRLPLHLLLLLLLLLAGLVRVAHDGGRLRLLLLLRRRRRHCLLRARLRLRAHRALRCGGRAPESQQPPWHIPSMSFLQPVEV